MVKKTIRQELKEWALFLSLLLVIYSAVIMLARPTLVIGPSMEPTLRSNQLLLAEKISVYKHTLQRGDIVSFKSEMSLNFFMNKNLIKRIIGLPGDHIVIQNELVFINDVLLNEDYIRPVTIGEVDVVVPDDAVFVMGDNRENSSDSRFENVGFVSMDKIKGKVYFRILPFDLNRPLT